MMAEAREVTGVFMDLATMAFQVETRGGHRIILDASPEHGGAGRGPSPMEMLLAGLAGCTGMDVISLLRKMRQDVTAYEVRVSGVPRNEHPRTFAEVHVEHIVRGRALDQVKVRRAVELSETKYCPVSATLAGVGAVRHRATILDDARP